MAHATHKLRTRSKRLPPHFSSYFLALAFFLPSAMAQNQPAAASRGEAFDAACKLVTRPETAAIVGQPKTITPYGNGSGSDYTLCQLDFADRPRINVIKYPSPQSGATLDPYDARTVYAFLRLNETIPHLKCQQIASNAEWCVLGPAIPTLNGPDDGKIHIFSHDIRDSHALEICSIGFSHLNDAEAVAKYKAEAIKLAAVVSKELNLLPPRPDGK